MSLSSEKRRSRAFSISSEYVYVYGDVLLLIDSNEMAFFFQDRTGLQRAGASVQTKVQTWF